MFCSKDEQCMILARDIPRAGYMHANSSVLGENNFLPAFLQQLFFI